MCNLRNCGSVILARMVGELTAGVFINVLTQSLDVVSPGFVVKLVLWSVVVDWA